MAVTLLRAYGGFAASAKVIFPDDTESALISQGWATAATQAPSESTLNNTPTPFSALTFGGNVAALNNAGQANPAIPQGPRRVVNVQSLTAFASMGTSTIHTAGTWGRAEIYVPHWATWTGIAVLNGGTVGTDSFIYALYDTAGNLIANTPTAGTLSAGSNVFQEVAFTGVTAPLAPGRYFIGVQCNGTTATTRRQAAADGGLSVTSAIAGTFGTVPTSFTVPTTFTTNVGPIAYLYQ